MKHQRRSTTSRVEGEAGARANRRGAMPAELKNRAVVPVSASPSKNHTDTRHLDQFYTKPEVARRCWRYFQRIAARLGVDEETYWLVEPAAGCGCFYQLLPPERRIGLDIDPGRLPSVDNAGIVRADYLKWTPPKPKKATQKNRYAVIGNPPFGKRSKLAVAFFNHSAYADIIALVVPVAFRKHTIHHQLLPNYALVGCMALSRASFCTPDGRDYAVNAEFQVWTCLPTTLTNGRELHPAPISHPDFDMRQYNNTAQALKLFDARFDFAVPCQGYQDYTRRETDAARCERHKQWMLFTAHGTATRKRLMAIDYGALALHCATAVPGFRKNDVVKYYDSTFV